MHIQLVPRDAVKPAQLSCRILSRISRGLTTAWPAAIQRYSAVALNMSTIERDVATLTLGLGLGFATAACLLRPGQQLRQESPTTLCEHPKPLPQRESLNAEQISRYSRQLLLPCFGTAAQLRLCSSSALVIGAGGLGSPVIAYLAGAGIGRLGVVDDDVVDVSNLHRQVIHGGTTPGINKAISAGRMVAALNPMVDYVAYQTRLTADNAAELVRAFDVVIDASDNMLTRYLVNDACVLQGIPLVSGAAIGTEGYCTVYNDTATAGPCYRCIYGLPPPAATVASCSENGVLGAVPGVIGCIQAVEALKLLGDMPKATRLARRMCMYDALSGEFRSLKLRARSTKCAVCGDASHRTIHSLADSTAWCRQHNLVPTEDQQCRRVATASNSLPHLSSAQRIDCMQLQSMMVGYATTGTVHSSTTDAADGDTFKVEADMCKLPFVLLDVREAVQFEICALPHSLNVPLKDLTTKPKDGTNNKIAEVLRKASGRPICVICRRGVDSVTATHRLLQYVDGQGSDSPDGKVGAKHNRKIYNVDGGLDEWHKQVDPTFPVY